MRLCLVMNLINFNQYLINLNHTKFLDIIKKCEDPSCNKAASYGLEDKKIRQFCSTHKSPNHVLLNGNPECEFETCTKSPSYGIPGELKTRCAEHKLEGMKNLNANYMYVVRNKLGEVEGYNQYVGAFNKLDKNIIILKIRVVNYVYTAIISK